MALPHLLTFSLAAVALIPGASLLAGEAPDRPVFSKHVHDAIVAGFRKGESAAPVFEPAAPLDIEPEAILLPKLKVVSAPDSAGLSPEVVTPKTQAAPLALGTGVTEIKGKKFTVLIPTLFFIPIGFKLAW